MSMRDTGDKKGPGIGGMLGRALLGPLGAQLMKSGGLRSMSPAMMAIDAIKGNKEKRRERLEGEDRPGIGGRGDVDAMMGRAAPRNLDAGEGMKRGGKAKAKKYAKGGKVSSASKRADGCATKGKTKGRFV